MDNLVVFWIVALIAFSLIEIFTMGLTTIWFAGGSLIAFIVALVGGPLWLQVTLMVLTSILLLIFTRPVAVKYFNKDRVRTNVESMVGKQAIVISEVDNLQGIGQVNVSGNEWSARSSDDRIRLPEGTVVRVLAVSGVKLIVGQDKEVGQPEIKPEERVSIEPEE